ncbi:MAG TPA: SMC family ATPase [Pyrinomonadaceae bacterium]|jgi:exonuclease SbcC|nr:SMC family ATPase [Pyrinomonadaceae bacterium]
MHVTRIELENIKAYEHAVFTFARGTTAITGENGAGKTTILESIAWALFDTLEYSKEDFLRRGAKRGSVRVTFESDKDERLYTVYRDTGQGYYVYDEGLRIKIAEKKADVSATLRLHLGIEPGTDLKALFRSAIGVPQGSFTAEFLLAPNARKAAFDRLLKVEEYRDGAERLLDTVHLIRERTAAVRERIASAEGQLARYDELLEEHSTFAGRALELGAALEVLEREIAERVVAVAAMDEAEQRVSETRARADRLEIERAGILRRLSDLEVERDAARAALERLRAAQPDHQSHVEALEQLRELEAERAERDKLRAEEEGIGRLSVEAKGHVRRLEEAVERAVEARRSIAALAADTARQEELERERERLRDLRAEALSARALLTKLDAELTELRAQHVQTRERARAAERGRGAQERVARLESERMGVETSLSQAERAATSLKHLSSQRKELARETERLRRELAAYEKEAAALERHSERAAAVGQLSARETELTEQLAHLRAEIARDEKFHAEVRNGLCPILSERCLNIGEDQTLEDYFKDQYASNTAQLGVLEKERLSVIEAVRGAREAEKHLSRLESVRAQATGARKLLTERDEALARLDREVSELPPASRERLNELRAQLSGIDGELILLREAALSYAELKPLEQRLKEIEQEGKRKRDERASVAAAAEALLPLEKDIEETETLLRALNDPRGRARSLRAEAESESERRSELAGAADALQSLEKQAQSLQKRLARYTGLDARWDAARRRRDETDSGHRIYLASEALAQTLPARQAELEKAEQESGRIAREAEEAGHAYEAATRNYDREHHSAERVELSGARERAATLKAQLEAARSRESALAAEIERLAEVRDRLRDEFLAREKLEGLNETTEFIRDTLKQAGPLVTESYLYNISIEANQLFREITGDAGRALRWSRDYEIMLEEEGHERSFPNLSGGEQMAAALSVRLALLKQLSDIRMAFFDEPTTNMDAERRERLAQQIGQIRHFDQLFVISHDDTFEESVDNHIHIPRRGAESVKAGEEEGMRPQG